MMDVGVHVSRLEARVTPAKETISTNMIEMESQYLHRSLQHNGSVKDDNPGCILSLRECAGPVASVPAEPQVLPAETTRATPGKEPKGKIAVTHQPTVQSLTFTCISLVPFPFEKGKRLCHYRSLWQQSGRLERAVRRQSSLFGNIGVLWSNLTGQRW